MTKKDFRDSVLSMREALDKKEAEYISRGICYEITELAAYKNATDVCLYMAIKNEVDLTSLMKQCFTDKKNVWLPRVIDKTMEFYAYTPDTKLITGAYDIKEPDSDKILSPDDNTLIVMPGAVFSEKKERIGYGGGYYDRYMAKYPCCKTVAPCFELQVYPEIPTEGHDIKPDIIITEERTIV